MKKILKKEVIIAFIIGLIIASSITVYAYSCAAKDVSYTKPGENTPISVETALNELYNKTDNLIWSNSNLLNDFDEQTIPLDLSQYSQIIITGIYYKSSNYYDFTGYIILDIASSGTLKSVYNTGTSDTSWRNVSCNNSGVTFGKGNNYKEGNNKNGYMIPTHIIGIK